MLGFVLLLTLIQANINCEDISCRICLEGNNYQSKSCLSLCPSSFITQNKTCFSTDFQILFSIDITGYSNFSSSSIEMFTHPSNEPFDRSNKIVPLLTKDRGLYFTNISYLVSNQSWILAPDFSILINFRV